MSDKKLNDIISKIYDIKMSYNFVKIIMSFKKLLCIIMSFKIERHNITRVNSRWRSDDFGAFMCEG